MSEIALIGKKIGMSREFYKSGYSIPVTILKSRSEKRSLITSLITSSGASKGQEERVLLGTLLGDFWVRPNHTYL